MRNRSRGHFLSGLLGGLLLGILGVLLFGISEVGGVTNELQDRVFALAEPVGLMIYENLRGSALLFGLVGVFYLLQIRSLRALLAIPEPAVARVARHEQLIDLCATLFFGIGVIWTAIGMRDALLFALGEPGTAVTRGSFDVLQRLVDGGILLALSTTIVGGIGGYLMRAAKSVCFGHALAAIYLRASEAPARQNLAVLQTIERHLVRSGGGGDSEQGTP